MELNIKTFFTAVITLAIAIVFIVSGLVPALYDNMPSDTQTYENTGAGPLRFAKADSGFNLSYDVTEENGTTTLTVTNGSDVQTCDIGTQLQNKDYGILYADNNLTVFLDKYAKIHVINQAVTDTSSIHYNPSWPLTISGSASYVRVNATGMSSITSPAPNWAYIPNSTGEYAYYQDTGVVLNDEPTPYAASYAGISCYNDIVQYDLPLTLTKTFNDDKLTDARWTYVAEEPANNNTTPAVVPQGNDAPINILGSPVPSSTYTDGDWGYEILYGSAVIVSYLGSYGMNVDITIPSTVGGYTVTQLGSGGEHSPIFLTGNANMLGGLTIPNTVTRINDYAFEGVVFTGTLTFSNAITSQLEYVGQYAFAGCGSLDGTISLPDSVRTIGFYAFTGCTFIDGLELGNSLETIGAYAFYGCGTLSGGINIPTNVTIIGNYAFSGTNIDLVRFVSNGHLNQIGNYAFAYCHNLSGPGYFEIPDSVEAIGEYAFKECAFDGRLVLSNSITEIKDGTFEDCGFGYYELEIPNSVTKIGDHAFSNCNFFKVVLSNNLTEIGDFAFQGCNNINRYLTLPSTLTKIGDYAFAECHNMVGALVIPASVNYIGEYAFWQCGNNGLVSFLSSDASIDPNAFKEIGYGNNSVRQVLNLGTANITKTSYGLQADEVRSDISAGYIAPTEYEKPFEDKNGVWAVLGMVPIVVLAGLIIVAVGIIMKKEE